MSDEELEELRRRVFHDWGKLRNGSEGLLVFADALGERDRPNFSDSALVRAAAQHKDQDQLIAEWGLSFTHYEDEHPPWPGMEVERTICELRKAVSRIRMNDSSTMADCGSAAINCGACQVRSVDGFDATFLFPLSPAPSELWKDFDPGCCLAYTLEGGRLYEQEVNYQKTLRVTKNAVSRVAAL